jgi:hypothetical protein
MRLGTTLSVTTTTDPAAAAVVSVAGFPACTPEPEPGPCDAEGPDAGLEAHDAEA